MDRLSGFFIVLIVATLSSAAAAQQCEHDCGPLGDCALKEGRTTCADGHCNDSEEYYCKCKTGYWGDDCSLREPNPCKITGLNSTLCYNGGVCEQYAIDEVTTGNRCNCQAAFGDSDIHAGPQCEHDITDVCEVNRASSHYAFCTNEGLCNAYVLPGEEHPGCNCDGTGFEGRHCQFPEGKAPEEEIIYVDSGGYQHPVSVGDEELTRQRSGITGFQVFLVLVIVGSVVALGAFIGAIIWKKRQPNKPYDESGIELDKMKDEAGTSPEVS